MFLVVFGRDFGYAVFCDVYVVLVKGHRMKKGMVCLGAGGVEILSVDGFKHGEGAVGALHDV